MVRNKLYSIGEALIDFIPQQKGCAFSEIKGFMPAVGGAPANVCAAFSKLGGKSEMITQLGNDSFGHKIADELAFFGIGVNHISFTDKANTALAFVSLAADGNRTFSFYRNPSADMLLEPEQIEEWWFDSAFALHFCSVSLVNYPIKRAHIMAIEYAKKAGAIVSFDPNLRFALWNNHDELKRTVWEFIPKANVLKISDEELFFLTGKRSISDALPSLFIGDVQLVLYTCGSNGAYAFTKENSCFCPAQMVEAIDTTGAGDAFAGSFLYRLCKDGVTAKTLETLTKDELDEYLRFSNAYCAKSVQKQGAIISYPIGEDFER